MLMLFAVWNKYAISSLIDYFFILVFKFVYLTLLQQAGKILSPQRESQDVETCL